MDIKKLDIIKYLIIFVVFIISMMSVIILGVNVYKYKTFFGDNGEKDNIQTDYKQTSNITKINATVESNDNIESSDILFEQSRLINISGTSILTTKITNNGATKNNVKVKIKLKSYNGTTLIEVMGYVGKIKNKEIKYIDSFISIKILNSEDIVYELMK